MWASSRTARTSFARSRPGDRERCTRLERHDSRNADGGVSAPAAELSEAQHDHELHAFVLEIGRALSLAGAAVSETQERLIAIAAANGAPHARIVVLPTALIISLGRAGWATVESIPVLAGTWRLDQISALYELVDEAQRAIVGKPLTPESIAAAAESAFRPAKPLDNTDFAMTWRKEMVRQYVKGALEELARP